MGRVGRSPGSGTWASASRVAQTWLSAVSDGTGRGEEWPGSLRSLKFPGFWLSQARSDAWLQKERSGLPVALAPPSVCGPARLCGFVGDSCRRCRRSGLRRPGPRAARAAGPGARHPWTPHGGPAAPAEHTARKQVDKGEDHSGRIPARKTAQGRPARPDRIVEPYKGSQAEYPAN
jgi:hypothetical protein